jgi:His-Xaa-Ser system radical SAM maturase HxsB
MIFPLRFRPLEAKEILFVNEAGDFFVAHEPFLARYAAGCLTPLDRAFLERYGHAAATEDHLFYHSFLRRIGSRQATHGPLRYVILVPTLRCNLACTYCQVSRVAENARGFDWKEDTVAAVLRYLDNLTTDHIKIEFQGGEPLLRLDLLKRIHAFCEKRFKSPEFVVCTNLQALGPEEHSFLARPNVLISTSLDGDAFTHQKNRTRYSGKTTAFFDNLRSLIEIVGVEKVSALPTIDYADPPDTDGLINAFGQFGLRSIYMRPVNYHGFARQAHSYARDSIEGWNSYYFAFLERLIEYNFAEPDSFVEEYYFKLCLSRVLRAGHDTHVNLRNPSWIARDYIVIDYDGMLYPTDEARMITRVGQIDLSIGNVHRGPDEPKVALLNRHAFNNFHEDCIHCPYQPYCGTDLIDDLSRYGRIDVNKLETWFCRRHMAIFDRIFSYIYSDDPKIRFSLLRWAGLRPSHTAVGVRYDDTASL